MPALTADWTPRRTHRHWAAFPGKDTAGLLGNKADLTPDGETLVPNADRPADCFFVHP